jgi:hypothetical protein
VRERDNLRRRLAAFRPDAIISAEVVEREAQQAGIVSLYGR